jgi:hypothetical protein
MTDRTTDPDEGTGHKATDSGGRTNRGPAVAPGGEEEIGGLVPPYEGRKEEADLDRGRPPQADANVRGATNPVPVDDPGLTDPDPESTPGGATASPADEQPAAEADGGGDYEGTGPAHTPGVARGEDQER